MTTDEGGQRPTPWPPSETWEEQGPTEREAERLNKIRAAGAEAARRSRAAAGLSMTIDDPLVIARLQPLLNRKHYARTKEHEPLPTRSR
jgi:hypothetical protein